MSWARLTSLTRSTLCKHTADDKKLTIVLFWTEVNLKKNENIDGCVSNHQSEKTSSLLIWTHMLCKRTSELILQQH